MGASESTARTNGRNPNNHDDDEPNQNINPLGAAAAVAAVGAAAWGISKMLSDNNTETQEHQNAMQMNTRTRYLPNSSSSSHTSIPRSIYRGPYKMNTAGRCRSIPGDPQMRGPSGFAGVLRDNSGEWVQGFRGFIGVSDCLTAEFHGIYHGLLILDKPGYRGSVLESDSRAAIEWIKNDSYRLRSSLIRECWDMILECKRLVLENGIDIKCISRDDNKCADKLAFMAIEKQDKFVEIYDRPNEIKQLVNLLTMQMNTRTRYLPNSSSSSHMEIPRSISRGPYKMNTDGSCRSIPGDPQMRGPSGFGGVLRDNGGEWVQGFRGFIGVSDCLTAEFHGIYHGLRLLAKLGYRGSILQSDSSAAIEWIKNDSYRLRSPLIRECWDMISECKRLVLENEIDIKCISRNENKCADKLAVTAIDKQDKFVEIYDRPNEIKQIV